jgi:flagellar motor switch/type III secretory pathway protein FliN
MISALALEPARRGPGGRSLREVRFVRRSALPISAACLVANGVREHFSRLLGRAVETEVIAPVIPGSFAVLFEGATIKRVRGRLCETFVVVRPLDARRLVAIAFAESAGDAPLSPVERLTLDRLLAAVPPLCAPLCGDVRSVVPETPDRAAAAATTYFEVRIGEAGASLGFALSSDPAEDAAPSLAFEDLGDVEIECTVECAQGSLDLELLARLREGMTLPLDTPIDGLGTLRAGGIPLVRGTCGGRGGRAAFVAA